VEVNNTNHAGKETENKYVFKREQKTGKVVADVTSVGRLCSSTLHPGLHSFHCTTYYHSLYI